MTDVLVRTAALVVDPMDTGELAEAARLINWHLRGGTLQVRIGTTLSLAETARAHALVEAGFRPGRVVDLPQQ